jgi:hypothetical protein
VTALTRLVLLLSGGHLRAKYLGSAFKPCLRIPNQVRNYQFINKDTASPHFLMSCQSCISEYVCTPCCELLAQLFFHFRDGRFLNLQFLMIYFRNFLYDIRYSTYLDMTEDYLLSLVQASSSCTSRKQQIIS